jgi:pyruvate dehydrogenase E2 component (dihydrolipoamide acetyltransferase)
MSIEVVMPQMGESITEGTVSKWLKKVGEHVDKDEPVLEISTDKVDAEVPSPGAGTLLEIRHQEGETVEVGTIVAVIGAEGEVATESSVPTGEAPTIVAANVTESSIETPEPESTIIEAIPTEAPADTSAGAAEVVMPQMGESITEGTVSKWLKSVGDAIEKDEPLLEISTDKVDAEVPSPTAGTLLAINVKEGETVEVGAVLALVGTAGGTLTPAPKSEPSVQPATSLKPVEAPIIARAATASAISGNGSSLDELRRIKSSPLVRNIAREHGVDITRIPGSGISGRVTKNDILSFIESGAALRPQDLLVKGVALPTPATTTTPTVARFSPQQTFVAMDDRIEKMSVMRKKIAEHMTFSKQTSAHVTSVYEIDMTNVAKFRNANQVDFSVSIRYKVDVHAIHFPGSNCGDP